MFFREYPFNNQFRYTLKLIPNISRWTCTESPDRLFQTRCPGVIGYIIEGTYQPYEPTIYNYYWTFNYMWDYGKNRMKVYYDNNDQNCNLF